MEETFREDIRIIWRFLSKYKQEFYVTSIIVLFGAAVEAFIPYIYGRIVEFIVADEDFPLIFSWLMVWFAAQLSFEWTRRYLFVQSGRISIKCVNDFILLLNQHW